MMRTLRFGFGKVQPSKAGADKDARKPEVQFRPTSLFTIFIVFLLIAALIEALNWELRASIIVLVLGGAGLVLAVAQLVLELRRHPSESDSKPTYEVRSFNDADPKLLSRASMEVWAWLVGLVCAIPIVGLPVALPVFVFAYAKTYGASWKMSAFLAALIAAFIYGVYIQLMHVYWPSSLLGGLIDRL
jgi:hypothetical protein